MIVSIGALFTALNLDAELLPDLNLKNLITFKNEKDETKSKTPQENFAVTSDDDINHDYGKKDGNKGYVE